MLYSINGNMELINVQQTASKPLFEPTIYPLFLIKMSKIKISTQKCVFFLKIAEIA